MTKNIFQGGQELKNLLLPGRARNRLHVFPWRAKVTEMNFCFLQGQGMEVTFLAQMFSVSREGQGILCIAREGKIDSTCFYAGQDTFLMLL